MLFQHGLELLSHFDRQHRGIILTEGSSCGSLALCSQIRERHPILFACPISTPDPSLLLFSSYLDPIAWVHREGIRIRRTLGLTGTYSPSLWCHVLFLSLDFTSA
jgi:hypothetical protein